MNTTLLLGMLAVLMATAVMVVNVLRSILPKQIAHDARIVELENRLYTLHSEAHDQQERLASMRRSRDIQSSERLRLESEIRKMKTAETEIVNRPPLFVHEIGDAQSGHTRFFVDLRRRDTTRRRGAEGAPSNPIWGQPNMVEVWAKTQDEARQLVDTAFPTKLGFIKTFTDNKPTVTDRLIERMQRGAETAKAVGA